MSYESGPQPAITGPIYRSEPARSIFFLIVNHKFDSPLTTYVKMCAHVARHTYFIIIIQMRQIAVTWIIYSAERNLAVNTLLG